MPIPQYQTIMLPVLQLASDGATHSSLDAIEHVAWLFKVTADERKQLLPSGRTPLLNNRTHWALTYLRHGGLLESDGRGKFKITARGLEVLAKKPAAIDKAILSEYPGFDAFAYGPSTATETTAPPVPATSLSPEESLEATYLQIRQGVEKELLDRLLEGSPTFFEKAVIDVLVGMEYGGSRADAAKHLGKTGDGGLDGVINEDRLGLDKIFVQAKRYAGTVGRPEVQAFAGSLDGAHARKGVMITTGKFSPEARAFVEKIEKRIVLIDGAELVGYMVENEIGVHTKSTFQVYRIDDDFFDAES